MNSIDFLALLPLLIVAGAALLLVLQVAFYRCHLTSLFITLLGLGLGIASLPFAWGVLPRQVGVLLTMDAYGFYYIGLIFAAALAVAVLAYSYLQHENLFREEFYILLLLATLGSALLVASTHFASFFLSLELLTVALYALIAYRRHSEICIEAGLKYLVLAAASAAFLLFGMALVYAQTGTLEFARLATTSLATLDSPLFVTGLAMMIVGFGFKLAVVPFHMWTADVYEGAPAPVTAFIASASKGGVFALLLRFFPQGNQELVGSLFLILALMAMASMIIGNLLALLQDNVKRILAYSSIAHLGYLLVAFLAAGELGPQAAAFYLTAYFITTIGAFGVIGVMSRGEGDVDTIECYRGLAWRRPWLTAVLTIMLLSLAGIPLTGGFLGKFFVLTAGVRANLWSLVFVLVATSVIGLFYYLRVAVALYSPEDERTQKPASQPLSRAKAWPAYLILGILTLTLIWIGTWPSPLLEILRGTVALLY
ncbi:NADH-quinone oxidoreductase subunit N [bacterium]|nr:NADH-quinone oxidoreductase subunit N [bacterium]